MRTIQTTLKATLLAFTLSAGAHAAEPLKKLSDTQLDSIAAGLTIEVFAAADAFGPVTDTYTVTNVSVRQLPERGDGYIYTKGKGSAYAYAKGTDVRTFVDGLYHLDTGEEVVSIKIIYKKKRSKPSKHKKPNKRNKHTKSKKHKSKKPRLVTEKSRYKIRVVTRVPAP